MKNHSFLLLFLGFCTIACNEEELKAPIPAFLTINDIEVETTSSIQGSTSDNITNAKVFINDNSIGTFELPATIPIQRTGNVNLKIFAAIQNNGFSNDIADYPFYQAYEVDTTFTKEQSYTLTPKVKYSEIAVYDNSSWSGGNFEDGINFDTIPTSDTSFVFERNPSEVFEGRASGLAYLSESQRVFEAISAEIPRSNIPVDGRAVYLEFNYKSTHNFAVSVYTNNLSQQYPVIFFRGRDNWTKVYVELSPVLSSLVAASNFNIAFGYSKAEGQIGRLLLDNIKLIHFPT